MSLNFTPKRFEGKSLVQLRVRNERKQTKEGKAMSREIRVYIYRFTLVIHLDKLDFIPRIFEDKAMSANKMRKQIYVERNKGIQ